MRGPNRGKVRVERKLRSNQTDAERKLWFELRDRRLGGFKFVRHILANRDGVLLTVLDALNQA